MIFNRFFSLQSTQMSRIIKNLVGSSWYVISTTIRKTIKSFFFFMFDIYRNVAGFQCPKEKIQRTSNLSSQFRTKRKKHMQNDNKWTLIHPQSSRLFCLFLVFTYRRKKLLLFCNIFHDLFFVLLSFCV